LTELIIFFFNKLLIMYFKSQSEGCGFDPRPMLDGSGVKAMPGSIYVFWFIIENKKIQVAKWGTPKIT